MDTHSIDPACIALENKTREHEGDPLVVRDCYTNSMILQALSTIWHKLALILTACRTIYKYCKY